MLKNLLSNAFKFTEAGGVTMRVHPPEEDVRFTSAPLRRADRVVGFSVSDTGLGIPDDKLKLIFEAFQQADGTTSRKYGGTGLGLSISREITRLLGGELRASSAEGEGSTFTLYLPAEYQPAERLEVEDEPELVEAAATAFLTRGADGDHAELPASAAAEPAPSPLPPADVADDRADLGPGDRVVLIVEPEADAAGLALERARERGFKGVVTLDCEAAPGIARELKPDAVLLATDFEGTGGSALLRQLKRHPETRHIPVHVVGHPDTRQQALAAGAVGHLERPAGEAELDEAFAEVAEFVERRVKRLLVVEDDETERRSIAELIGTGDDVEIVAVASSEVALSEL